MTRRGPEIRIVTAGRRKTKPARSYSITGSLQGDTIALGYRATRMDSEGGAYAGRCTLTRR